MYTTIGASEIIGKIQTFVPQRNPLQTTRIRTAEFFITNFIHFQKIKNFTILKVAACIYYLQAV